MTDSPSTRLEGQASLILVVEDQVLIALDLAGTLEDEGYRVLGPAPTVAAALRLLGQERPDAAVLDMNLRGEMVTPVARLLQHMNVPFVIASADDPAFTADDEVLAAAKHLGKPTAPALLIVTMRGLLSREAC